MTIQILGPFNSGTNLLKKMLHKNITNKTRDQMFQRVGNQGSILCWKHTSSEKLLKQHAKNTENVFIIMYKRPDLFFKSILKAPYSIKFKSNKRSLESEIVYEGVEYQNLVSLFNHTYLTYKQLIQKTQ